MVSWINWASINGKIGEHLQLLLLVYVYFWEQLLPSSFVILISCKFHAYQKFSGNLDAASEWSSQHHFNYLKCKVIRDSSLIIIKLKMKGMRDSDCQSSYAINYISYKDCLVACRWRFDPSSNYRTGGKRENSRYEIAWIFSPLPPEKGWKKK